MSLLTVTEKAQSKALSALEGEGAKEAYLRVYTAPGCAHCGSVGYGLAIEKEPKSDDTIVESGALKLVVDKASVEYLRGAELDYFETMEQSGFKINNPTRKSGCNCGH